MKDATNFKPHSQKQEDAIFSDKKRILLLGCGTQYGKTIVGAIRMKRMLHKYSNKDDNFLITAPTYKILEQSTLPAFLKLMENMGTYNKKSDTFKMFNGGTVYCRTETDPDSIVGITNIKHIWGDEAGKYRLYFWENLQARADFCGCDIDLTTSPYSMNWIYKDLIKKVKSGDRDDVNLIQAASWENPYHSLYDPIKLSEKRNTMDTRRFNMIYGGQWDRMEGLVYDCWDDEQNLVDIFPLPAGTTYVAGVDWGYYPDPFVIKVRAITPDGRHYGVSEFVKTRLTITEQVEHAKKLNQVFNIKAFYCDPSQPGSIQEFCNNGCIAMGADNSIRKGIDIHYELIKSRRYKEFRGACPHSMDERESYHYPEEKDLKPDQDSKEQLPVDAGNHCNDADRYISIMTRTIEKKLTPRTPDQDVAKRKPNETTAERLDRITKVRNSFNKAERWN